MKSELYEYIYTQYIGDQEHHIVQYNGRQNSRVDISYNHSFMFMYIHDVWKRMAERTGTMEIVNQDVTT